KTDAAFMLYEGECPPLRHLLKMNINTLSLFTGSEGGFSEKEVSYGEENKILPMSLGKRILRCETAPLAALSAVLFFMGDMD
ncbi:MAG: RsmE family RNA methyltransferase, partial [Oscillospiraceae bacterium]